jgi:uncharacterized membrane protein
MACNKHRDFNFNAKAMAIHVTAYSLFLVSLVYFYMTTLSKLGSGVDVTEKFFGININIRTLFASLSQMCLCLAFWEIHKLSGGN